MIGPHSATVEEAVDAQYPKNWAHRSVKNNKKLLFKHKKKLALQNMENYLIWIKTQTRSDLSQKL